jgi:hypothetical protein
MNPTLFAPTNMLPQGPDYETQTPVMSDLQNMLAQERKQHQDAYGYANGHNDHGMGQ